MPAVRVFLSRAGRPEEGPEADKEILTTVRDAGQAWRLSPRCRALREISQLKAQF